MCLDGQVNGPLGSGLRGIKCVEGDLLMNRRKAIGSMTAVAAAAPLALGADDGISLDP